MANILFLDIETGPYEGETWGPAWDANMLRIKRGGQILCVSYAKGLDGKVKTIAPPVEDRGNSWEDGPILEKLMPLLEWADILVGHNMEKFDLKRIQARMARAGFPKPSPCQIVDTLKVSRKEFNLPAHKLAFVCNYFDLEEVKTDSGGLATWFGCLEGDQKAWRRMLRYAKQDIEATRALYLFLRDGGWITNHPNLGVIDASIEEPVCFACGGTEFHSDGFRHTTAGSYRRLQCKSCHSRSHHYQRTASTPLRPA